MKNYREEWTVRLNKATYILNEEQANLLKSEIARGNRGVVMFKEFAISIPYIEEFFLSRKVYDVNRQLSESKYEVSEQAKEKMEEIREKFRNKLRFSPTEKN